MKHPKKTKSPAVKDSLTAPPASKVITITMAGDNVSLNVQNLGSHVEIYGILKQAELLVPAIKWEAQKS